MRCLRRIPLYLYCLLRVDIIFLQEVFSMKYSIFTKEYWKDCIRIDTYRLCMAGMLVALQFVMGNLTEIALLEKQYNLGFLPVAVAGALLGPFHSMIVGALGDILGAIIVPKGPYFPGITVTSALVGLIYGLLLYKQNSFLWRAPLAVFITGVLNLFLNSFWLSIMYSSKSYLGFLTMRAASFPIEVPLQMVVLVATLFALRHLKVTSVVHSSPNDDLDAALGDDAFDLSELDEDENLQEKDS